VRHRLRRERERKWQCHDRGSPPRQGASCLSLAAALRPDLDLSHQRELAREKREEEPAPPRPVIFFGCDIIRRIPE
jgi:hypothetical protein